MLFCIDSMRFDLRCRVLCCSCCFVVLGVVFRCFLFDVCVLIVFCVVALRFCFGWRCVLLCDDVVLI